LWKCGPLPAAPPNLSRMLGLLFASAFGQRLIPNCQIAVTPHSQKPIMLSRSRKFNSCPENVNRDQALSGAHLPPLRHAGGPGDAVGGRIWTRSAAPQPESRSPWMAPPAPAAGAGSRRAGRDGDDGALHGLGPAPNDAGRRPLSGSLSPPAAATRPRLIRWGRSKPLGSMQG
jgi:hypothetical protein